ncbi:GNAT family N-acetyltransferase [Kribbella sp. NPDC056861]|uniref:GNAT family N-acetyltransferase n=1 Tax=Kribbella sp. NPDC056861 TaxID=3154857 RepID=UPI00343D0031
MAELPAGAIVGPMRLDESPALQAFLAGRSIRLIGVHQYSPEGVANFLRNPVLDLESDTWVVTADGAIVGTAATVHHSDSVGIDVSSADRTTAEWLLDRATERAAELGREADAAELPLSINMIGADRLLAELAAEQGFTHATSIQRMKILHSGPINPPALPDRTVIHRGADDEQSRRTVHRLVVESFAEQPDASPPEYDEWVASREARTTFDWSQVTVLDLDGQPVAVLEYDTNFVNSEGCGYVGRLGVLKQARGRGLAKYLLRDQFAQDAAVGLAGTLLHVNSSNPTPAVSLYLSAGMTPDIVNDVWRRTLTL